MFINLRDKSQGGVFLRLAPLLISLAGFSFACGEASPSDADSQEGSLSGTGNNSGDGDSGGDGDGGTGLTDGASGDGDANGGSTGIDGGSGTGTGTGTGDSSSDTSTSSECDVKLLFANKCGECHGDLRNFAELDLFSDGMDERLIDVPSVSCADWPLVVPGSPERSNLYQKVASDSPPCGERMPIEEPLTSAEIECVAEYIRSLAGSDPVEECETCGGLTCVDSQTDPLHCGSCGSACSPGQVCEAGSCTGCDEGTDSCDGSCIDTQTNPSHCGACGTVCGGGQSCVEGQCQCDSGIDVSFSADVQPILTRECTTACHDGSDPTTDKGGKGGKPSGVGQSTDPVLSEGLSYDALVGVASGCGDLNFVEPFEVGQSYLMNKLLGVEMCGGSAMPKGGARLTQTDLDIVGAWICGGALDD